MFFEDKDIKKRTKDGKRLYFDNEIEKIISPQGGLIRYKPVIPRNEEEFSKKVFSKDVEKIIDDTGNQVAISKTKFAELVFSEQEPFNEMDFSEFRKIFEVIKLILNETK